MRHLALHLPTLAALALLALPSAAQATSETCPNEARRVEQASTYLPDCRAYELVTPIEKGVTQDLSFTVNNDFAIPASDGERLALEARSYLGADPGSRGSNVIFSRGASGWEMTSLQPPGGDGEVNFEADIFNAGLTQVGVEEYSHNGSQESSRSPDQTFAVGSPGGPYREVATTPFSNTASDKDALVGASSDFSHVVLEPHAALSTVAVGTDLEARDLYDFTNGQLHLVNVNNAGALVSKCGAVLGFGGRHGEEGNLYESHAVWGDGTNSKIFFTSPQKTANASEAGEPGCTSGGGGLTPPENPHRLYMRVNDSETVEVSAPQLKEEDGATATPCDPGTWSAEYQGASGDGSKVFFTTESELTPDHTTCRTGPADEELYEYNTVTRKLTRISRAEPGCATCSAGAAEADVKGEGILGTPAVVSEDGSAVYFWAQHRLTENASEDADNLYRYDTLTGTLRLVVARSPVQEAPNGGERGYATPNGEFYLFPSQGLPGEPRGQGHNEMYLYDNADGKIICVSCGSGDVAPQLGDATSATDGQGGILNAGGLTPPLIPMSSDGRYVFFNSTAQLVPRDTNDNTVGAVAGSRGQDVYEWEAPGTVGAPGVVCREVYGCTHLISSGKDEHRSFLLGASLDGSNVFFVTAAQLAPQDQDTLDDIYDARIGGGFAAPAVPVQCSGEACKLVGSAPPLISTPLSATFSGAGNILTESPPPPKNTIKCSKGRKLGRGKICVKKSKRQRKKSVKFNHREQS